MERFSQRERVLLGYSPGTRAFSPTKELDIDFNDVFGGPPRRSSTQDMRHSFNESMKYTNNSLVELEDANPRSGLGERPVFGEETLNRRKHPSDDFYDDIFRGDESISSPRRTSPFASTPGSRVLSPARPLPPRADPSGSSLPAQIQFSLPAILSRGMEFPAFASSNHSPYKNKEPISSGKGFQYTPSSFLSRHSNEPFQEEDALRNEIRPSYRPSPLSHDISLSSKVPSQPTKYDEPESPEIPSNLKKDTKSTGSPNNGAQFHFSIYKWASKGVPVLMPPRGLNSTKSKDTVKLERCSSFSGRIRREKMASGLQTPNMHSISATNKSPYTEDRKQDRSSPPKTRAKDIIEPCHIVEEAILFMEGSKSKDTVKFERCSSFNGRIQREKMASGSQTPNLHNISGTNESPYTEDRKQDRSSPPKTSTKDIIEPCHIVEEAVLSMEESKSKDLTSHIVEAISVSPVTSYKREGMKTHSLSAFVSRERTEIGIAQPKEDEYKLELKSLHSFLNDAAEVQGNDKSTRKSGGKDSRAKDSRAKKMTASDLNADFSKKLKKRDEKKINPVNVEEIQMKEPHPQDLKSPSGDNLAQSGVKGKVKDFVKIFNQEADLKPKIDIKTQSQSSRWGSGSFHGKDKEDTANASETNGDVHNKKHTAANASVMSDKNIKKQEKHQPQLETSVLDANETFVGQKDAQESTSETLLDRTEFTVGDMDDLFHENFTIEELSNDQDKPSQNEDNCEDIETSDARIRKWSNGKEGNIRSLLSTLQYVLWPGSGWKAVPLVDIIEGSAVKRAYQKALLCLHPDKLQQKGAAAHQKYIAEKVFDILQEAWDQFNSLGLI